MTAPLNSGRFTVTYSDEPEKLRKLTAILARMGYRVEKAAPEMVTIGELARRTGRNPAALSRTLRHRHCPPVVRVTGKRRTLLIGATKELLAHLTTPNLGGRPYASKRKDR